MKKAFWLGWQTAALVFIADQCSKQALLNWLEVNPPPLRIATFFDIVLVWNRGISFGMFTHYGEALRWLLIGLTGAVTLALVVWLQRTQARLRALAIGLVIGGAVGNIVDRLRFGAVADFFSFHLGRYTWPAFNVADSAICIGVALLLIESMLVREKL